MKFLVDMPVSPRIAEWLRKIGHDAVHAWEIGLERATDEEILNFAIKEKRVVITADLDYSRLIALSFAKEPGIILFRKGNYGEKELKERLEHVLEIIPEEEFYSSVIVVEKFRIRRTKLPLLKKDRY